LHDRIIADKWRFIKYDDFFSLLRKYERKKRFDLRELETISKPLPGKGSRPSTMDEYPS